MQYDEHFFEWIKLHALESPNNLRLKYHGHNDMDYDAAITQVECRQRFGSKLAKTLEANDRFIFPTVLAGEQSTSDALAEYHASLCIDGKNAVDLTSGLGIDVFHISKRACTVTAVELAHDRADALRYNADTINANNISIYEGDCNDFIDEAISQGQHYATAFIDPARRSDDGKRVFALNDCQPNVVDMLPRLSKLCDRLIIKASPMLDISHTASVLSKRPTTIAAIGVATECRELLIIIDFNKDIQTTAIEAVTITSSGISTYRISREREDATPLPDSNDAKIGDYICEPWPTVMKIGTIRCLANDYNLNIFHPNTRLYHTSTQPENFNGNAYKIIEILPYASKIIKRFSSRYPQLNIATRNFGMTADQLRAKLKVRDGGTLRLYGITTHDNSRILIICEPI